MRSIFLLLALCLLPACASQNAAQRAQPVSLAEPEPKSERLSLAEFDAARETQTQTQEQLQDGADARNPIPPAVIPTPVSVPVPAPTLELTAAPKEPATGAEIAELTAETAPKALGFAERPRVAAPAPQARLEPDSPDLRLDETMVSLIKRHHGLKRQAYLSDTGVWMIGYGRVKGARPGMEISAEEAETMLREDLAVVAREVRSTLRQPVGANEFSAMVALAHSIGTGAFRQSRVPALFNRGDIEGAADAFLQWNTHFVNGRRVEDPALSARRMRERAHFLQSAHSEPPAPQGVETVSLQLNDRLVVSPQ